jgi:hypothetical protein
VTNNARRAAVVRFIGKVTFRSAEVGITSRMGWYRKGCAPVSGGISLQLIQYHNSLMNIELPLSAVIGMQPIRPLVTGTTMAYTLFERTFE